MIQNKKHMRSVYNGQATCGRALPQAAKIMDYLLLKRYQHHIRTASVRKKKVDNPIHHSTSGQDENED